MRRWVALAGGLVAGISAQAQGRPALVVGAVIDRASGVALSGVAVSAAGGTAATTDDEGFFVLPVSAGRVTLGLSRSGYIGGSVDTATAAGDTLRLRFMMMTSGTRRAQALPAVAVTEKRAGLPTPFLRRKALKGGGRFYVEEDIAKLNPPHVPALLQRLTGGLVVFSGSAMVIVSKRGTASMRNETGDACPYAVILNDLPMQPDFDLRVVKPEDLVGLEVYNGASSIPPELGGTQGTEPTCGLVVIWTRGGR